MTRIVSVQGLQWGSESKGGIATMIAHTWRPDTTISAWAPNAGHTAYIDGVKFVHSMLPLGALAPSVHNILLGPGTVLDVDKLHDEMMKAGPLLIGKTLIIHPAAALLCDYDVQGERDLVRIGSTMKGSMHAVIRKMGRGSMYPDVPSICRDAYQWIYDTLAEVIKEYGMLLYIDEEGYDITVDRSVKILLEGAQGYGLGLHNSKFYPHCTSRDVSTAQLLADCRVPFQPVSTIGVCRTFPIRVANRFKDGTQVGTSGPSYPGQKELDWVRDLGREPELTTVTKLPRRIFNFSIPQLRDACRVMSPTFIALTFCDYLGELSTERNGATGHWLCAEALDLVQAIQADLNIQVRWVTTSPTDIWNITVPQTGLLHRVGGPEMNL